MIKNRRIILNSSDRGVHLIITSVRSTPITKIHSEIVKKLSVKVLEFKVPNKRMQENNTSMATKEDIDQAQFEADKRAVYK